ncbi:hypothetical protein NG895_17875 [Aeoliella sp. ICT_H6.2]|uniref:Uncharacterized protein n=1 Tax=Aeoliella straminimaris TaxID=2954799 RepID=A0A9X2FBE1_9BACT|nr:hypothetical protein [Aeoliella straminimaris]MCO6045770.1 hypothetical protein [Aeoliella straminimaris]
MAFFASLIALSAAGHAAEIRTYRFTGEEFSYSFGCGECGSPPYYHRARVEGTFEVELDIENGAGTLIDLDAWLVDIEGGFPIGTGWDEWEWRSSAPDREFLSPDSPFSVWYHPPFSGTLALAAEHPLAPDYSSGGLLGPDFPSPDPAALILANTGSEPNPNGPGSRAAALFQIAMLDGEALFSYHIPIDDAVETILGATAVQVVPESESATIAVGMVVIFCMASLVRRRALSVKADMKLAYI